MRPHIVWFGEVPFEMHAVKRRVQACDGFVTVGSSGVVYPAAGLVREVTYRHSVGRPCGRCTWGSKPPRTLMPSMKW